MKVLASITLLMTGKSVIEAYSFKCLDFAGLTRGEYVTDQLEEEFGITVRAEPPGNSGFAPDGAARIFDTANPGVIDDGDPDLGSPNENCPDGGPGVGSGGGPNAPFPNCEPLGNVLIIQESDKVTPDDNARGGTITFDFVNPVILEELTLMDIQSQRPTIVEVHSFFSSMPLIVRSHGF